MRWTILFAVLGNRENNFKTGLSLLISKELVSEKGWHAGKIIRDLAKCIDGGGGGQEFMPLPEVKIPMVFQRPLLRPRNWSGENDEVIVLNVSLF